jgi:two-component system LytT family response regulator
MMKTLRLLIVEDEPLIREGIKNDLANMGSVKVAGECDCVAEAVETIRSTRFDIVLLDVQLPDGTGFDVIREIGPQQMPSVIFVTAYDKYAIEAFEVNAVDYLMKPFDESRLRESIERAQERITRPSEIVRKLEGLMGAHETRWLQRLVVRNGERFDLVPVGSIDWIESANNYTILHCHTKTHLFSSNLAALEKQLDPERFLRVQRGYMVNATRVVAVHSIAGGIYELELGDGKRIRTGRQYRDNIHGLLKAGR